MITVCITSCNRFDLLKTTIDSFLKLNTYPISRYIINEDSGNVEVLEKIRKHYGHLIEIHYNDHNQGLLQSVDKLYKLVETPYIFHCFKGDTLIETIDGAKQIKNIQVGDLVKTHTNTYKKVLKTFKHNLKAGSKLLWLYTQHSILKVTPEHPFYVLKDNIPVWVKADQLSINDNLLYPITHIPSTIQFNCKDRWNTWGSLPVTKDMAKFLGLYLAEGCGGHDSIRLYFNNNEKELHQFVIDFCVNTFKRKPTVYSKWATVIKLNIRSFSEVFINWFGKEATIKRIPTFVFEWDLINKINFINGYILGDGCVYPNSAVVVSASLNLIKDFIKLCNSCGLSTSSIDYRTTTQGFGTKNGPKKSYAVRLPTYSWNKLQDLLNNKQMDNYIVIPIKNILNKKQGGLSKVDANVYNLEVEEDNSYIANSVITHNCEDDWEFQGNPNFIQESLTILEQNPNIHQVWIRHGIPDSWLERSNNKIFRMVRDCHFGDWCGFSFNPGLRRLSDYKTMFPNGYNFHNQHGSNSVQSEHDCNMIASAQGYRAALLNKPSCKHIGDGKSTRK